MIHDEALEARLERLGLAGDALIETFPLIGRLTHGPRLVSAECGALNDLMQGASRRYQLLEHMPGSVQAERRHAINRMIEAMWWRAKARLRRLADRRRQDRPSPYAEIRDRKLHLRYPIIARLVFGPDLSPQERRLLMREMVETKSAIDDARASMAGDGLEAAIVAETLSLLWACAGHLHPKS